MATSWGVNDSEKAADSELAESSERSDRQENTLSDLFTVLQKVAAELENNKETVTQTKNEIASLNRKLDGVNGNIKGDYEEVLGRSCANTRNRRSKRKQRMRQSF